MKTNDPIVIRRVNNGFLVTPQHHECGARDYETTFVFEDMVSLATWLYGHFPAPLSMEIGGAVRFPFPRD